MAKMNISQYELSELKGNAEASALKESFRTLYSSDNYRVGVGYRIGDGAPGFFYIEVILAPCRGKGRPSLETLEFKLRLLRRLELRKNSEIRCEDDGSVTCEFIISERDVMKELSELESLFMDRLTGICV